MHLIDYDKSKSSRLIAEKFNSTGRFFIVNTSESLAKAKEDIADNVARMALIVPSNFEKALVLGTKPSLQILLNAEDGSAAAIIQSYSMAIINDFNKDVTIKFLDFKSNLYKIINIEERFWYNTSLDYKNYMVPGILCILVTIIGMFLSGMNIVREKEMGTIEQLNVTPIKKYEFVIGKLFPFWMMALLELASGLFLAKLIFNIPIEGSIALIFAMAATYLLVVLSIGLLISTITETQQQAMFISWFFLVLFILMSGLFTPIKSMPEWAQTLTLFNPIAHFIEIMRRILLKGAEFKHITVQFTFLLVYVVVMIMLSIWRYRKVSN
jgi:ABC-2 type transport system permease protein